MAIKLNFKNDENNNNLNDVELKNNENEKFEKAKEELYSDFTNNMKNSSIDVEITEDVLSESIDKYKKLQIKKMIILITFIFVLLSITCFGLYNTFFRHEWTGPEIAAYANYYNGETNFPISGVQGFLNKNLNKIITENMSFQKGVSNFNVDNILISEIVKKNNNLANVYFSCNMSTNNSINIVNCMLPINYDGNSYSPAGSVLLLNTESAINNIEKSQNPYLSFEGINKMSEEETESSKKFIDNFFTILYSKGDITPYYNGNSKLNGILTNGEIKEITDQKGNEKDKISDGNIIYNGIIEWNYYSDYNTNGYNGLAVISLTLPNGIIYQTEKYIEINRSGESWMINTIM